MSLGAGLPGLAAERTASGPLCHRRARETIKVQQVDEASYRAASAICWWVDVFPDSGQPHGPGIAQGAAARDRRPDPQRHRLQEILCSAVLARGGDYRSPRQFVDAENSPSAVLPLQ